MLHQDEELIGVRDFLEERLPLVREDYFSRDKNVRELIRNDLNLPENAFQKLEDMCNPRLLYNEELLNEIAETKDLDPQLLSTIEYVRNFSEKTTKRNYPYEIKFLKNIAKLNEIEPEPEDRIILPDVAITVQISQPLNSKLRKLSWSEDFIVLGQCYLTELRDKISCLRNEIKVGEFSKDPESIKSAMTMKEILKSGYFFIENTLYNDLRGDNVDCSIPVIKWGKENNLGDFQSQLMETTKFIDLKFRLGFPYLYNHLGDCQHLIIFTGLRLVNPTSDCYSRSKYPIVKDRTRGRFTFCWCCNVIYAKWIVCNSLFSVEDPTFLCDRCLKNTHFVNKSEANNSQNAQDSIDESLPTTSSNVNDENVPEEKDQNEPENSEFIKACDFKAFHYSQM